MELQRKTFINSIVEWIIKVVAAGIIFILSILPVVMVLLISEGLISLPVPNIFIVGGVSIIAVGLSLLILKKYDVFKFDFKWINKTNLILIVLGYAIIILNAEVLKFFGLTSTSNGELITDVSKNIDIVSFIISTSIVGPILEECFYRGAGMGIIFGKNSIVGVLVVSILFCLSHGPTDMLSFINYFVPALVFCFSYYKSKRLEVSTTLHLINNIVALIMVIGELG